MAQKVGPKGQVVIPKKFRDELGIENKQDIYPDLADQPNPCPTGQSISSIAGRHT